MSSIFIPENLYPDCGTVFKEELEGTQVVKKNHTIHKHWIDMQEKL